MLEKDIVNAIMRYLKTIAEMWPKAGYFDVVLACKDAVAISVILTCSRASASLPLISSYVYPDIFAQKRAGCCPAQKSHPGLNRPESESFTLKVRGNNRQRPTSPGGHVIPRQTGGIKVVVCAGIQRDHRQYLHEPALEGKPRVRVV